MDRKQERGKPRCRDIEAEEQIVEEAGHARMEKNIDEMIAEWIQPPHLALEPESREHEGIVLWTGIRFGPYARQAMDGCEGFVIGEVKVIVPYVAAFQGGSI